MGSSVPYAETGNVSVIIASSLRFPETRNFFATTHVSSDSMCKILSSRDKNLSSSKLLVLFTEPAMFQQGDRPPALPWLDWACYILLLPYPG